MKNIPEKIYLQVDADGELPEDFNECHEVSWCTDNIYETDLIYFSEEAILKAANEIEMSTTDLNLLFEILKQ